jgi:hypothetical protein
MYRNLTEAYTVESITPAMAPLPTVTNSRYKTVTKLFQP